MRGVPFLRDVSAAVVLPAWVLRDVDLDAETVLVNRTKNQIKNAPEFDEDRYKDEGHRNEVGDCDGRGGADSATKISS